MPSHSYRILTHWQVAATIDEVADIFRDVASFPRWWPAVFLDVELTESGDCRCVGRAARFSSKGWLPYVLGLSFTITESCYPSRFVVEVQGDLAGRCVCRVVSDTDRSLNLFFDWCVEARRPLIRLWSWLFRPLFASNHVWVMARGQESLHLEVLRRRSRSEEEAEGIAPPPNPAFPHDPRTRRMVQVLRPLFRSRRPSARTAWDAPTERESS